MSRRAPKAVFWPIFAVLSSNIIVLMSGPLLLSACATKPPEPVVITKTVSVEVTRPCTAARPDRPAFQGDDAKLHGMNGAAERYQALMADNPLHFAYELGLENVLTACGVK